MTRPPSLRWDGVPEVLHRAPCGGDHGRGADRRIVPDEGVGGATGVGETHVHFHGKVYAVSDIDFQNMVPEAMQEMKRKGRLVSS